jgi:T-complex protein 1 subunit eta
MDLSAFIRKHALSIPGKLQLIMTAFAKALEIIPRQICDNAGLDSTDILNKLRMKHANGEKWYGVDVDGVSGIRNNMDAFVWEPSLVKTNAISSATEAACLILSVDETVRNPQSEAVRNPAPLSLFLISLTSIIAKSWTQSPARRCTKSTERQGTGHASTVKILCALI